MARAVEGSLEYVCWRDLMGARNIMKRSLLKAATAVMTLHNATLQRLSDGSWNEGYPDEHLSIQPIIDGVYIRASRRGEIERFIRAVMTDLANGFLGGDNNSERNLFRGGLAFGPVIDANDPSLDRLLSPAETESNAMLVNSYRNNIAMGMALSQAYESEGKAPPYGVYVHESARAFAPEGDRPFPSVWFHWWKRDQSDLAQRLAAGIDEYYAWAFSRARSLDYAPERMKEHQDCAHEYFVFGEGEK